MKIYLIGFMGSGKSHIARKLANTLNLSFFDTDHELEKYTGKTIPEFITENGIDRFRDMEFQILTNMSSLDNCVIATGGGIIENPLNQIILKNNLTIFLDTDFAVCYDRINNSVTRPLAFGKTADEMFELYSGRMEKYQSVSTFSVSGDGEDYQIVENICDKLGESNGRF